MAVQREELRKAKDYPGSDSLRALLQQRGVTLNDATHTFSANGWEGTYDLHVGFTAREIQYVALEREEARRDRHYDRGDSLRQWLAQQNVNLDDKTHTFTMSSGEAGSYDLYSWTPVMVLADAAAQWEPPFKQQRR